MNTNAKKPKLFQSNIGPVLITELNRPDGKKLICDASHTLMHLEVPKMLAENDNYYTDDGYLVLVGKMQCAEAQNQNGRSYPRRVLKREVQNYMNLIKEKRAWGELDHPDNAIISCDRISHLVTELWWSESNPDDVMGRIKILKTPSGLIVYEMAKHGPVGVSSRGLGSVTESANGMVVVNDDYQILCWDIVSDPSTFGAFMYPKHLRESRQPRIPSSNRVDSLIAKITNMRGQNG